MQETKRQVFKTVQGNIRSNDLKAIQWYMVKHALKPVAINVFPDFSFRETDGTTRTTHLADIQDEYEEFKRTTHGRRKQAT